MVAKLPKGVYILSNVSNMQTNAITHKNMQVQSLDAIMSLCGEVQCVQ